HRLERLDFGGQAGGDRDAEFVREFFAELTVTAERQASKERRAAENDRVAVVIDQILDGFLDATQLFFKVAVDQLTHRAGGVEHHESFGKHFVKLINQRVTARRCHVADASAPSVHVYDLLIFCCAQFVKSSKFQFTRSS